eukprot:464725-Hanusia_phi.AAC.1
MRTGRRRTGMRTGRRRTGMRTGRRRTGRTWSHPLAESLEFVVIDEADRLLSQVSCPAACVTSSPLVCSRTTTGSAPSCPGEAREKGREMSEAATGTIFRSRRVTWRIA